MSTVEPKFKTILPRNENDELKGIDTLSCTLFSRFDLSKINILPAKVDSRLLSDLAFAFDVDVGQLDVATQRKLIEISYDIHRYAGTPYALKRVFEAIDKEIEVVEWHKLESCDATLSPFRFNVKLEKLDSRGAVFVIDLINQFKNQRSRLKQIGNGSCSGMFRLDCSMLDEAVLENIEGIDILDVKVCFKSVKTELIRVPLVSIEHEFNRMRLYGIGVPIPNILRNIERVKNRGYRLQRTWTGHWESTWDKDDSFSVVGLSANRVKTKSAKPNSNWHNEWTGKSWEEIYWKSKDSERYKGLNISVTPTFVTQNSTFKKFELTNYWSGTWNQENWLQKFKLKGEKNVSFR